MIAILLATSCQSPSAELELQVEGPVPLAEAVRSEARPLERGRLSGAFEFHRVSWASDHDRVTGVLAIPTGADGPVPVVVMTHGLGSDKSMMVSFFGPALAEHGMALLTFDLPLHGERGGGSSARMQQLLAAFDEGVREVEASAEVVHQLSGDFPIDPERMGYIGYSLGSFVGIEALADDPRFSPVVFNVLGTGYTSSGIMGEARSVTAAKNWTPRPTLMQNARNDSVIPPEGSKKVYDALPEPKRIEWYDSDHILPGEAFKNAVEFLAEELAPQAQQESSQSPADSVD